LDALEAIATTRAVRRYRSDPISDEVLSSILFAATRAPSGSNRQPARFVVLRNGERAVAAKALLGETFRAGWQTKETNDGYATGSGALDTSPKARMARAMAHYVEHIESTPVVVLACLVRYRPAIYPACQNLLLAARTHGVGGVLTMWHQGCEVQLRTLLDIPDEAALSACITLGYPQGAHGPVRRRPLGDVVFDDGWGQGAPWAVDPPDARFTKWKEAS
jgi:nitroreductase